MALLALCKQIKTTNLVRHINFVLPTNCRQFYATKLFLKPKPFTKFVVSRRNFFSYLRQPTKQELKIKDQIPDEYNLIYRNNMQKYMLYAQVTTSLAAFFVILQALITHDLSNYETTYKYWKTPPRAVENEVYIYITAFVGLVIVLQVMISRLPIRIYNLAQQKKYIFVTYGNLPFSTTKMTCSVGDVVPKPDLRFRLMPWNENKYRVKGKNIILMDHYFRKPADLNIMLGVQRDRDVEDQVK